MRVRVLDGDRSCLDGVPAPDVARLVPQDRVRTVVVEEDGRVVGTMSVALMPHIESVWIDPAHRNAGVTRALVRATWDLAREGGYSWAFGCADDDAKAARLERLGGARMPFYFYALPLNGG